MHIRIRCISDLPVEECNNIADSFSPLGSTDVFCAQPGPQQIVNELLPAVFTVALTEIAGGFLKQIGADLEKDLKNALIKLFRRGRELPTDWYRSGSERREPSLSIPSQHEKKPEAYASSPPLRVEASLGQLGEAKFIFPAELYAEAMETAISTMQGKLIFLQQFVNDFCLQEQIKQSAPERYFGKMPLEMVRQRLMYERVNANNLLLKPYIYTIESKTWVGIG
ncbi:hypothetical protein HLH36_13285 [Gluconacetobacter aggeris]|uniref:Uncharacterized protein n=1 Tax=Gluconacetobacter aggeris TaxID=1286186 RepID=A0A7W4NWX3_9PROT|nr:hypothetical protein [Gluconacetobacter aggeris]MBB2169316.1 hypothetical protein [Gluconacetobacter aggeris]